MLKAIASDFHSNVKSVHELVEFDEIVIEFAIQQVEMLQKKRAEMFDNPAVSGEHTIQALKNVRDHGSLKDHYKVIFNQAVVLLVSYFGSAVGDICRVSIPLVLKRGKPDTLLKEELTLKVGDLMDLTAEPASFGEVFLSTKKGVSFQDMQSTARAFNNYVGVDVPRGECMNNVIIAQAFRHAIVHKGGKVDKALLKQIAQVTPRTIKETVAEGETIQFTPDEVRSVSASMLVFMNRLVGTVTAAIS